MENSAICEREIGYVRSGNNAAVRRAGVVSSDYHRIPNVAGVYVRFLPWVVNISL